jgi:uncharacterized tellurite resistance protein B-like protein
VIDLVKRFFGKSRAPDATDPRGSTGHDMRIAACALFLEMANIDGEFSADERRNILTILGKDYQLSAEYATELAEAARQELEGSIDLWRFTNLINRNYSLTEKTQVIELMWEIAYADGKLDKHEDYLVHKLAKLLHLSHQQLIEAKLKTLRRHDSQ